MKRDAGPCLMLMRSQDSRSVEALGERIDVPLPSSSVSITLILLDVHFKYFLTPKFFCWKCLDRAGGS